jgi:predicted nucleic acid-binding protein
LHYVAKFCVDSDSLKIELDQASDNKFLELAVYAKANFLITGNTRHFTVSEYCGVNIISPKDYIENFWKV